MPSFDNHKNFATSLVATAPSPATSGTSLVVTAADGTKFPSTPFNAVICPAGTAPTPANAEVVRVTAISTDTFTLARAQESSSARTVVVGDQIFAALTAKSLTDIESSSGLRLSFRSGRYTGVPAGTQATLSGTALTQNNLYLFPIYVPYAISVAGLGVVVAGTVASSNVRLGIYNDGGAGIPTSLVVDAGTVDTHTATGFVETTTNLPVTLAPGLYWIGVAIQGANANINVVNVDGMSRSSGAVAGGFGIGCYIVGSVSGALPDPAGTMTDGPGNVPRVTIRVT